MRSSYHTVWVLLLGFALGAAPVPPALAQPSARPTSALVGQHPAELARHPEALAALHQALGARFAAEYGLLRSVGSEMRLVGSRYVVGVSMAPSSGGDPSIFVAYDVVARAAYLVRFGTAGRPGGSARFEVFSPTASARWPASLRPEIAAWKPDALPLIPFASDADAARSAGPPPPPAMPPPRKWLVGFGQGTLQASIGNDEGASLAFDCPIGHEDTSPGISLEVRSNRRVPSGQRLRVQVLVDGADRADWLRLETWRVEAGATVVLIGTMSGRQAVERTRALVGAIRAGRSLEVRVPHLNATERFSLVDAASALSDAMDGCLTVAGPAMPGTRP